MYETNKLLNKRMYHIYWSGCFLCLLCMYVNCECLYMSAYANVCMWECECVCVSESICMFMLAYVCTFVGVYICLMCVKICKNITAIDWPSSMIPHYIAAVQQPKYTAALNKRQGNKPSNSTQ